MARVKRQYCDSGYLFAEWFEVNGIAEGIYKSYWCDGQPKLICNYVNGKKEGEEKLYLCGQIWYICNYVNGIKQGEYRDYQTNGELWLIGNYVNDMKEGKEKTYYNGQLVEICNYVNGEKVSSNKVKDEDDDN